MEIEYSNEVKGRVHAYRFTSDEKKHIIDGLKPIVIKLNKKLEKIKNHPKNEGQATFLVQADEVYFEIKSLEFIIETLK